jgi:peptidyl-prolyl cis-trans isomerase D
MFISTHDLVRKHGPLILGIILAVSVGMGLLFTPSGSLVGGKQQRGGLPTIKGKPVNFAEFQNVRNNVLAGIGMARGRQPARSATFEDDLNIQALRYLVLLRKAKELGVHVTDDEVIQQIRALPMMLNDQKEFDPNNYQRYLALLNNLNISEAQFENVVRQDLILAHLRALVSSTAEATPAELQLSYNMLEEQTKIDYVELDAADHKDTSTVTDEEAKSYYEANQEKFRTPATVKVRYVYFTVSDARKSVTIGDDDISEYYERNKSRYVDDSGQPKPLAAVKEELKKDLLDLRAERLAGDRATAFSVKLVPQPGGSTPDFGKIAADAGLTVKETDFFDLRGTVNGVDAGPEFNQAAFVLGPDLPFSDPVRGKDGYYVLDYVASKASGIPPFEEVKAQVVDRIRQQRAYDATVKQGRELDAKIKEAVAAGKSFADACAPYGLAVKSTEEFTFVGGATNFPYASSIKEIALGMATNAVSDFLATPKGGIFFHLKQRVAPKPLEGASPARRMLEAQLVQQSREALFEDWADSVMRAEQVDYKRRVPPPEQRSPTGEAEPAEAPAPAPAS